MVTRFKIHLLVLLTFLAVKLSSQKNDSLPEFINYEINIDFKLNGNQLIAEYLQKQECVHNSFQAIKRNFQYVYRSGGFSKDAKFNAIAYYKKKEGKYKSKRIKEIISKQVSSSGIFYDDLIETYCYYPNLTLGSKTYFDYQAVITDPVLLPSLYFNHEYPAQNILFKIRIPKYLSVKLIIYGDSANIEHLTINEKESTLHVYKAFNRKKVTKESNSHSWAYFTPHLIIAPVSFTFNNVTTNLVGTTQNLFERYNNHIANIKPSENAKIIYVADSLTKNIKDTLLKVKEIFNWVQKNIKYIAFEEGMNAFVPRSASFVFEKRYGDCKDKANLLVTMLNASGISAYHTWIGSRKKPYRYSEVSTPVVDDHMICAVKFQGKWIFLDATDPFIEIGLPSAFIQGKEALIRLNDKQFTVQKVEILNEKISEIRDSINIQIKDSKLIGEGKKTLSGYLHRDFLELLSESKTPESEINALKNEIDIGNNKLVINNLNHRQKKGYEVQFDFELDNYMQTFDNKLYVNLNLIKDYSESEIEDHRELTIYRNYMYSINQCFSLNIPKNKSIDKLPVNRIYLKDDFGFKIDYVVSGNKIVYTKNIYLKQIEIKKEKFSEWNEMIHELNKAYSDVVIIK